jgi:hypothetical protein
MIKELNRVSKLGYECEIAWNKHIQIYFDFSKFSDKLLFDETLSVLTCMYDDQFSNHNFEKYVEECSHIFYTWYSQNNELVQSYIDQSEYSSNYSKSDKYYSNREKLEKLCLGDVTKKVIRQIQIDDVIDDY